MFRKTALFMLFVMFLAPSAWADENESAPAEIAEAPAVSQDAQPKRNPKFSRKHSPMK